MDLKSELQESVAEARNAKATKDAWVLNAKSEATTHSILMIIWFILIVVFSISIAGLYTKNFSFMTNIVSSILGWVGLEEYSFYVCIALIVIGGIRIWNHINGRKAKILYANQIESMSLAKFRHTYM